MSNNLKSMLSTLLFLTILSSFVAAAPDIQILSPQNTNYASHKILFNVTSNETVDFFMKSSRNNIIIARNVTNYESFFYGKNGTFNFTIYANNSNGVVSKTTLYNITLPDNPINLTSCGWLTSANTEYKLVNDLSDLCGLWWLEDTYSVDLDLNGFTILGGITAECFFSKVYNGKIIINSGDSYAGEIVKIYGGDSCLFKDLSIETDSIGTRGISFSGFADTKRFKFENVNIRTGQGVVTYFITVAEFKNVSFIGLGRSGGAAFRHLNSYSDIFTLDEVTVSNHSNDIVLDDGPVNIEYTIRNSNINTSGLKEGFVRGGRWGITRLLKQHKLIVNLTDQNGNPISGAVEIIERDFNPNKKVNSIDFNPTAQVFVATNSSGIAETFLTEDIEVITGFSPLVSQKTRFDPYNITARSKGVNATVMINFSATNSTLRVGMPLSFQELPPCTITQMLDLNNDGVVDTQDALFVIRQKTGKPNSFNSTKQCEGINLNPF